MQAFSDMLARGLTTSIICFGIIAWVLVKLAKQNPGTTTTLGNGLVGWLLGKLKR